jgi:hypothetical protein
VRNPLIKLLSYECPLVFMSVPSFLAKPNGQPRAFETLIVKIGRSEKTQLFLAKDIAYFEIRNIMRFASFSMCSCRHSQKTIKGNRFWQGDLAILLSVLLVTVVMSNDFFIGRRIDDGSRK